MHTALMEASMDGHVEVAKLLLDSGAQVSFHSFQLRKWKSKNDYEKNRLVQAHEISFMEIFVPVLYKL